MWASLGTPILDKNDRAVNEFAVRGDPAAEPCAHERPRIRRLGRLDLPAIADHLLRLEPEDRRLRFGTRLSDDGIRAHIAQIDWSSAVLLAAEHDGRIVGLGEMRACSAGRERTAEVAFSVDRVWRGRDIGSELLRRLSTAARNRGIHTLLIACQLDNGRMLRLAHHVGARIHIDHGDVEARVDLPNATPMTVLMEIWDETTSFWPG
ncbi:MAG: GNAT family N-acetyltransferase [Geminicoccaceae bacterium]|nr:GNAT family N-acetyltransferase [Geminicoccaceae bacterium]